MSTHPPAPRFSRTPHLVALVGEAERLAALVAAAPAAAVDRLRGPRLAAAAVATLRLDGSPIDAPPDLDVAPPTTPAASADDPDRAGTWFDALRALPDDADTGTLVALEYRAAREALAADDLAHGLLVEPEPALVELHRRLTHGLLDPDRAGQPRTTDQAVHDASVGRVIYFPAEPDRIATHLAQLAAWLQSTGAREHGLLVSGVLHLELLRIHPFEAANGRLARTAARLVLRERGLDPAGLAAPEIALAQDPIGYHEDVAATARRRDHTIWLERWGEAVAAGLRDAAAELGLLDTQLPARPAAFLDGWPEPRFTVADYRAGARVGPEEARGDLEVLLDAGAVQRVPGARGLRFAVTLSSSRR